MESKNDLPRITAQIEKELSRIVRKTAFRIEARAKSLAPVDTGRLRASITTEVQGPLRAIVGTNTEYAAAQEFGTRFQSGTPFLTPAFDQENKELEKEVRNLEKSIKGI